MVDCVQEWQEDEGTKINTMKLLKAKTLEKISDFRTNFDGRKTKFISNRQRGKSGKAQNGTEEENVR